MGSSRETSFGQKRGKFTCRDWIEKMVAGTNVRRQLDAVVEICGRLPVTFSVSW